MIQDAPAMVQRIKRLSRPALWLEQKREGSRERIWLPLCSGADVLVGTSNNQPSPEANRIRSKPSSSFFFLLEIASLLTIVRDWRFRIWVIADGVPRL